MSQKRTPFWNGGKSNRNMPMPGPIFKSSNIINRCLQVNCKLVLIELCLGQHWLAHDGGSPDGCEPCLPLRQDRTEWAKWTHWHNVQAGACLQLQHRTPDSQLALPDRWSLHWQVSTTLSNHNLLYFSPLFHNTVCTV